jgi:hypothetical protein
VDISAGIHRIFWLPSKKTKFFRQGLPSIWSDFLVADPEVPGSIPGATRFSKYQWVWNGVHSALVRINEELLERKVAAPV